MKTCNCKCPKCSCQTCNYCKQENECEKCAEKVSHEHKLEETNCDCDDHIHQHQNSCDCSIR